MSAVITVTQEYWVTRLQTRMSRSQPDPIRPHFLSITREPLWLAVVIDTECVFGLASVEAHEATERSPDCVRWRWIRQIALIKETSESSCFYFIWIILRWRDSLLMFLISSVHISVVQISLCETAGCGAFHSSTMNLDCADALRAPLSRLYSS